MVELSGECIGIMHIIYNISTKVNEDREFEDSEWANDAFVSATTRRGRRRTTFRFEQLWTVFQRRTVLLTFYKPLRSRLQQSAGLQIILQKVSTSSIILFKALKCKFRDLNTLATNRFLPNFVLAPTSSYNSRIHPSSSGVLWRVYGE